MYSCLYRCLIILSEFNMFISISPFNFLLVLFQHFFNQLEINQSTMPILVNNQPFIHIILAMVIWTPINHAHHINTCKILFMFPSCLTHSTQIFTYSINLINATSITQNYTIRIHVNYFNYMLTNHIQSAYIPSIHSQICMKTRSRCR